ncbi:MAG: helix-turn-helix domain-containing protein, partial [Candidatus Omnitrophica bacterium]|nr:helix-turn-helix domain-containing protein [Candidatus Omnitrophota bacterium]
MEYTGAGLKKIRLERGISLEEVQKKTKIHLNILKAIEGDSLTDLSPVYLKGFLKIYCKFLGLDPKDKILDYGEARQGEDVKPANNLSA